MKTLAAVLLLLFSHGAAAGDAGTDQGIDGGTSGVSVADAGGDTPLAEVVQVDGGWFLTDARMLLVGQTVAKAQKDLIDCKAEQPEPPSVAKAGLIGAAAGFILGVAASVYFYVEVVKP